MAKNSLSSYLHIGENLKRERKAAGYTQREFAQLLGMPVSTYSNYENGNRDPGPETLKKIADALDVPLDRLLSISEQMEKLSRPENRKLLDQVAEEIDIPSETILEWLQNKENYGVYPLVDKVASILRKFDFWETFDKMLEQGVPKNERDAFIEQLSGWICEIMFRGIDRDIADTMLFAIKALNREGQEKALAYIEDLTRIPEYRKPQEDFEGLHTYLQKETQDAMRGDKE